PRSWMDSAMPSSRSPAARGGCFFRKGAGGGSGGAAGEGPGGGGSSGGRRGCFGPGGRGPPPTQAIFVRGARGGPPAPGRRDGRTDHARAAPQPTPVNPVSVLRANRPATLGWRRLWAIRVGAKYRAAAATQKTADARTYVVWLTGLSGGCSLSRSGRNPGICT